MTDLGTLTYRDEALLLGDATDAERVYVENILPAKLELYLQYIESRSLALDLQLMWRTALDVIRHRRGSASRGAVVDRCQPQP